MPIWNSQVFMTVVDLFIIAVTGVSVFLFQHKRRAFRRGDLGRETGVVVLALLVIGLFYLADLFTMWVLPTLTSQAVAAAAMRALHLEYHWLVMLFSVIAIFIGFVLIQNRFLRFVASTRQAEFELAREMASHRDSEEALRESQDKNRALLVAIPDMMFRQNANGTYLEFVPGEGVEPLMPPEDFLGKSVRDVMSPEFAEVATRHISRVLETGAMVQHEYSLPVGDEIHHFEYRMVPCAEDEVLGIVRDITDRKRVEETLRQGYEDLEERVAARTKDLHDANTALRAEMTERKQADEEARVLREELGHVTRVATMGELAASLAHELNQPLAAIVTNAQAARRFLSKESRDLDEVSEAISDIAEDGKRAGKVIRGLRELFKRGAGERKVLDVNHFIEDALELVRSDATMRNVTMTTRMASDLPTVSGDRVQLQQVLLNLIRNGSEAMSGLTNGERELVITTAKSDAGGVEVAVRDSGSGIEAHDLERIFDAFHTTKSDGLGMGLSINRSIVEAHKGCIWATPNADHGATFHVTLPPTAE